jgi:hypothetical protein
MKVRYILMIRFIALVTMRGSCIPMMGLESMCFMYRFLDGNYNHVYSVQDGHLVPIEARGQCFASMSVAV